MNGRLVKWADATVHVASHGLHYGSGVFEGIRAYETPGGSSIFRLTDHLQRLHDSARLLGMELPYSVDQLRQATMELVAANGLAECYLRPIAFYGFGELGVSPRGNPVDVSIISWPWGAYLGEDGQRNGIRAKISSWQRVGPNVIPHTAKATGIYLNSMLAVNEALDAGYDEAILLTSDGFVADGSGENIFVVRDGVIATPDLSTVDPARDHAGHGQRDRAEPGLRGGREEPDPLRPLPRRRGVHVRDGGRGDAAAVRRRRRARGRPGDGGDPRRVPALRPRSVDVLAGVARARRARARSLS